MFYSFKKTKTLINVKKFSLTYFLWCYVSVNVFLFKLCQSKKNCQEEYSSIKDSIESVQWKDYYHSDSPIIFSTPSCLDENGKTITRICINGTWIPENPPLCEKYSKNQYCPDNYYELQGFCVVHYDKKSVMTQGNLNTDNTDKITLCNGTYVPNDENYKNNNSKKICDSSNFVFFPYDHRFHLCPENCISIELGNNKCYCKVIGNTQDKLAAIETYIQKKAISRLAGNDVCKIDNQKLINVPNSFTVITHNFYGSTRNNTKCSIIETKFLEKKENPSLVLTFNEQKKKLVLIIENPEYISPSKRYSVKCSTNAGFDINRDVRMSLKKVKENLAIYSLNLEKYLGEYWCEALTLNLTKIQSNVVLAYKEKSGNEFSLKLNIKDVALHYSNRKRIKNDSFLKTLSSQIHKTVEAEVRFMKIYKLEMENAEILLHLTTTNHENVTEEYENISEKLRELPDYIEIEDLRAVEFCLPDIENSLNWGLTRIWERKTPKELCYDENNKPITRICQGDFLTGTSWSKLSSNCSKDIKIPEVTTFLNNVLHTNISSDTISNVTSFTQTNLSYFDIYLYSELIKKINIEIDENITVINDIFKIINNLSKKNKTELSSSQKFFNTTDTLLLLLDDQSSNEKLKENEISFTEENILIKTVNPFKTNISGFYLVGLPNKHLNEMGMIPLKRNETFSSISEENLKILDLAVIIPEEVLKSIEIDTDDPLNIQIIFKIFYEDSLFVNTKQKAASKVVSVSIPGYGSYLNDSIMIVMRSEHEGSCGYWDLGHKFQRKIGEWSSFGGRNNGYLMNKTDLHICQFSHLTHFALLILSQKIKIDEGDEEGSEIFIDEYDSSYLNMIHIVESIFSVFGIFGIFLTAITFKQWRQKDGTKILLNLSTAILLEIVFLQFPAYTNIDFSCKFIGSLLHYSSLSKFCWMLIYALLQYKRFVKVFSVTPKNLIIKSIIFGWGLPILPVILTLIISPESYIKTDICFLSGLSLHISFVLPVLLVISLNLYIFFVVMYNVTTTKVESNIESKFSLLQLYLAILLFFVLGIPWSFFILSAFITDEALRKILAYLFIATSSLQGFILFIFYVLFNEETRYRWRKYFTKSRE